MGKDTATLIIRLGILGPFEPLPTLEFRATHHLGSTSTGTSLTKESDCGSTEFKNTWVLAPTTWGPIPASGPSSTQQLACLCPQAGHDPEQQHVDTSPNARITFQLTMSQ